MKRPAFQFYPADWRKDAALQSCSLGARGLWHEMLCIMHECDPYGHLFAGRSAMTTAQLARLVGESEKLVKQYLAEIEGAGVFSRTADGVIYSRRMVKDEHLRNVRAEAGGKGGNPDLVGGYNLPGFIYLMQRSKDGAVKIGISSDPTKRLYKIRQQFKGQEVQLLAKGLVEDMGVSESQLHAEFASSRLDSEWFKFDSNGLDHLKNRLKAISKATPTPSSSSSSSDLKALVPGEPEDDGMPVCPHVEIIAAYHAELPSLRRVREWTEARQSYLRSRWREKKERQTVQWWREFFAYIRTCPHLMGQRESKDHPGWQADLEWIVRPSNFVKIIEGKYEKVDHAT